jgi:hypothetical protein
MQKLSLFILLAAASFAVTAQQQPPAPDTKTDSSAVDKSTLERARADGAAGGTAPVAPEKRKAAGAGAGPHLKDTRPSPQKLPRDEPVAPPK